MNRLLTYSGISTKIRSMKKKLLTNNDYEALSNLKSISQAVDYLKQKPAYRDILSMTDENSLHRGTLEQLLFYSSYRDFTKIYSFSNVKLRKFLDLYFLNYESTLLKSCFRFVFDHRNINLNLSFFSEFFIAHSKMDLAKTSTATSASELVFTLKDTDYYSCLHHLSELPEATLFDYEMAIDMHVFQEIWRQKNKLFDGKDLEILTRNYGYKFDLLNLLWIYRSKKYYDLSAGDIYNLILPIHYKLNRQTMKSLVEAATMDEFITNVQKSYYGKKYPEFLHSHEDGFLEKMYYALLYTSHTAEFRKNPFSIAALNSYLYLKHQEYAKLTTMLECIRYGIQPNMALKYTNKYTLEVLNQ